MALHVRKQYYNPFLGLPADSDKALTNIKLKEIHRLRAPSTRDWQRPLEIFGTFCYLRHTKS